MYGSAFEGSATFLSRSFLFYSSVQITLQSLYASQLTLITSLFTATNGAACAGSNTKETDFYQPINTMVGLG